MPRPIGRRAEIHETFIRHVAERGYDGTNLGDIATELGMSKGTIVHHFGTKAQMLRELEESYMRHQLDAVAALWERLPKPADRIAGLIYASTVLQDIARDATVATQREVRQLADDPAMQDVRKLRRELQEITINELKRGMEDGVFRAVDPELAMLQLFGGGQWMWVWFDPKGPRSAEDVGGAFVDVFLGGLLVNRKGLDKLAAPTGELARTVREVFEAAARDELTGPRQAS